MRYFRLQSEIKAIQHVPKSFKTLNEGNRKVKKYGEVLERDIFDAVMDAVKVIAEIFLCIL